MSPQPNREELMRAFGLGEDDRAAWSDSGLSEEAFEDWLTDRVARRPAGARARSIYGAADVHDFARRAILDALALTRGDRLLEIGCGGGRLLRDASESGAAVTGLDHSEAMVALARENAPAAEVVLGRAEDLPWAAGTFTAVAMSVVFMFFAAPGRVLEECRRVLVPAGRIAIFTTAPELRGTPAAPEPLAGRCHLYSDAELLSLLQSAGFSDVSLINDDGGQLVTASVSAG